MAEKLTADLRGRVKLEDAGFDWKILGPDPDEVDYVVWQVSYRRRTAPHRAADAPQMRRRCTADAPQMHRRCAADAPQMHRRCTADAPPQMQLRRCTAACALHPMVASARCFAWQSDQDAYAASGQKCSAQSMLIAHENWMERGVVEKLAAQACNTV